MRGTAVVSVFEEGIPPEFRIIFLEDWQSGSIRSSEVSIRVVRLGGRQENYSFYWFGSILRSNEAIPEPHEFAAVIVLSPAEGPSMEHSLKFVETCDHQDHNDQDDGHNHGHSHGHTPAHDVDHGHDHGHRFSPVNSDIEHGHAHANAVVPFESVLDHDHSSAASTLGGHDHAHSSVGIGGHDHAPSAAAAAPLGGHDHAHTLAVVGGHDHGHDHDHQSSLSSASRGRLLEGHDHNEVFHEELTESIVGSNKDLLDSSTKKKAKKPKKYEQDNNFRAAIIHVVADAFVSLLVIAAICIAGNVPGAGFLDPMVAIIGSFVIVSWGIQLMSDTSMNLLDITPDQKLNNALTRLA